MPISFLIVSGLILPDPENGCSIIMTKQDSVKPNAFADLKPNSWKYGKLSKPSKNKPSPPSPRYPPNSSKLISGTN